MTKPDLDLYTDYLLSTFGATTATGLSAMVEGEVSHDQVTRFLSAQQYTSKDLWQSVKRTVRSLESDDGVLIFDDTIQEKAWSDESELMCWHFDHCSGRTVKGINLLNALYHCNAASIPVAFELVKKPIQYCCLSTRKVKRKSEKTKNELMRDMIQVCVDNALKFRFVLMDSWYASEENFDFIRSKGRHFIAPLKDNRLIALSEEDKKKKRFVRVDELDIPERCAVRGWLKGHDKEVLIARQVFKNKDDSTGVLHLVCSDLEHDYDAIPLDLQKTVASGGVSQILEVQRQLSQVTHAHCAHAEQPCLYGYLRHLQAAMPESCEQDQPVCAVSQIADQCAVPMPSCRCCGRLRNITL